VSQEHRPSRNPTELKVLLVTFNRKVKLGLYQICLCCKELWFPKQINKLLRSYLENIVSSGKRFTRMPPSFSCQSFKFCATFHSNIKAGRKSKGAIFKGLDFPEVSHSLRGLTILEERLILPRFPFR